jgi:hypothetical protein
MLANDITLDAANGTDVVYRLVSNSVDGSRRIDIASTLALPAVLNIKHSVTGKPPLLTDRHLIQISKTIPAAIGTATCVVNLTITVPRDAAVTSTVVHDVLANLIDLLLDGGLSTLATSANIDALLRGES